MHLRHRFGYVVVALTLSLSLRAADPVWWQVRSQNFILFTDTSEAKGIRLLTDLEARHAELADVFGGIPPRPFSVEVFLFEKAADFSETIPKVPAGTEFNKSAYLVRGPDRVFVVAKDKSPEDIANDVGHALGHVFFERLAWWRPFWLSEGAAEYFRKVSRSPDTKAVSEKEGFLSSDLLKIVPSAGYDDDAPPTAFRVQSHRLFRVLLKDYRPEFRDFLKVLKTAEGAKARPNVPEDSLQARLSDYVETRITATTVPALESRELSPTAVAIHRGDLLLAAGKTSEAAAWYNGDSTQARAARAILTRFSRSGTEPIRALARASQDLPGDGLIQLHFGSIETQ